MLERDIQEISKPAAADLSTYQYRAVLIASNRVNIATGTASKIIGILQNKPAGTAHAARVAVGGVSKMIASASITSGDWVSSNGEGMGVAATGATSQVVGRALESASGSLSIFEVLIQPHQL